MVKCSFYVEAASVLEPDDSDTEADQAGRWVVLPLVCRRGPFGLLREATSLYLECYATTIAHVAGPLYSPELQRWLTPGEASKWTRTVADLESETVIASVNGVLGEIGRVDFREVRPLLERSFVVSDLDAD